MPKVSEAQIKASRKNEAKNPERTYFHAAKRSALSFARGGKDNRFEKYDKELYKSLLNELIETANKTLKELN